MGRPTFKRSDDGFAGSEAGKAAVFFANWCLGGGSVVEGQPSGVHSSDDDDRAATELARCQLGTPGNFIGHGWGSDGQVVSVGFGMAGTAGE